MPDDKTTEYQEDRAAVKEYYADLLILQYRGKPKARETIKLGADIYMADGLIFELQDLLDIDKSIGPQLDIIGKILDAPRMAAGVKLEDEDYRLLLKFKLMVNVLRASIKDMDIALWNVFNGDAILYNGQNLSITYIISSRLNRALKAAVILGYLRAPIGIEMNYILEVPEPLKIFGFNRGDMPTNVVGFSSAEEVREGTFLTKDNLITAVY